MLKKIVESIVVKALTITGSVEWVIGGKKYIVGFEEMNGKKVLCLYED